ncbi:MAG: alpha/beta fold hydrolase [Pseudomonadota bacterium]
MRFAVGTPTASSLSLVAVHPFSGIGMPFRALALPLAATANVIGISARGLAAGQTPFSSYQEMLEAYAAAIGQVSARQPVVLLGWSMGGPIAFDLTAQLSKTGRPAAGLIILDAVHSLTPGTVEQPYAITEDFSSWCQERLQDFGDTTAPREGQSTTALSTALIKTAAAHGMIDPVVLEGDPETLDRLARVSHGLDQITRKRHVRVPFPGPTLIVRAAESIEQSADPLLGWSPLCTDATGVDVPYGHFNLMQPDAAQAVAEKVCEWINRAACSAPN